MSALPPLREVVAAHGLNAKKSLGQNFLFDLNLTGRIARTVPGLKETTVIEIGPGPGGLTRALLDEGAKKVIAIERDERCRPIMEALAAAYPGRFEALFADAMEVDVAGLADGPLALCANLPYNIGTQLLIGWLTPEIWPPAYRSLTLMFQKEVAERIVAAPGSKAYGRLSVLASWRCSSARILFDIAPSAFVPPPKVTSSVIELIPNTAPAAVDPARLEEVVARAFGQRRKMLRAALKGIGPVEMLFEKAGLKGTERAEEIDVATFVTLANALSEARQAGRPDS